jgi:hypothetical protein
MNSCKFYPKGECGGYKYCTLYVHSDPVVNKKVEEAKRYLSGNTDMYTKLVSAITIGDLKIEHREDGSMSFRYDKINTNLLPKIKDVIFNDPATIVYWADGTKTVVKAENELFDPEKGLAMAIAKKALGNKGNYFNTIKKWVEKYEKPEVPEIPELKIAKLIMEIDGTKLSKAVTKLGQDIIDTMNKKTNKKKEPKI